MLSRLIKVVTNKPTNIESPVFTKPFDKDNKQIAELENLLNQVSNDSRSFIENDIKKLKYGSVGEGNIYYELKHSFMPMVCLHNVRIEYKGLIAQIDFIIITTKNIYVIECKNLIGDIGITDEGEFIRYKKNSYGKLINKEGIYSPIVQNERHINVLKELLKDKLGYNHKLKRIESLVVIANPKTVINKKYAPKDISAKIIKYDQLIDVISKVERNKKIDWVFIEDDMMKISDCLINHHKEIEIDYFSKYNIEKTCEDNNDEKINDNIRLSLKHYRLESSAKEKIKPYMVFNNNTMEEIIKIKPKSVNELMTIKGMGAIKCEKYGKDIVDILRG